MASLEESFYEEPFYEELEEDIEGVAPHPIATQETKESYKAILNMLLTELEGKKKECEVLQNLALEDVGEESVLSGQDEFQRGFARIKKQHDEISEVELFFSRFTHEEGGGSSSSSNEFAKTRIAKILEDCKASVQQIEQEKHGLEEAQHRLKRLVEIEDEAPFQRYIQSAANDVTWQQEMSPAEVIELKKKLAARLKWERTLKRRIDNEEAHNSFNKSLKKWWMQMDASVYFATLNQLHWEERATMAKIESSKAYQRRIEEEANRDAP